MHALCAEHGRLLHWQHLDTQQRHRLLADVQHNLLGLRASTRAPLTPTLTIEECLSCHGVLCV